jgi:hypothetical protein
VESSEEKLGIGLAVPPYRHPGVGGSRLTSAPCRLGLSNRPNAYSLHLWRKGNDRKIIMYPNSPAHGIPPRLLRQMCFNLAGWLKGAQEKARRKKACVRTS